MMTITYKYSTTHAVVISQNGFIPQVHFQEKQNKIFNFGSVSERFCSFHEFPFETFTSSFLDGNTKGQWHDKPSSRIYISLFYCRVITCRWKMRRNTERFMKI